MKPMDQLTEWRRQYRELARKIKLLTEQMKLGTVSLVGDEYVGRIERHLVTQRREQQVAPFMKELQAEAELNEIKRQQAAQNWQPAAKWDVI